MATGSVVMLARNAQFGFVRPDGAGADAFFHHENLDDNEFQTIEVGSRIKFDVIEGRLPGKFEAINVRMIGAKNDP